MSKNRLGGKRDKSSADISVVRLTLHISGRRRSMHRLYITAAASVHIFACINRICVVCVRK